MSIPSYIATASPVVNLGAVGQDAWDDTEILKAYNKAVKNWRKPEEIEDTPGPGPWVEVEVPNEESIPIVTISPKVLDIGTWILGSPCRAIYSEDGLEYEAKVVGMQGLYCTVRFVGYGNEERVNMNDLKGTYGKKSRDKQRREALHYQRGQRSSGEVEVDELDDCFSNISVTSSMCNNYTDSVCRDRDLEETLVDAGGHLSRSKFQTSTPHAFNTKIRQFTNKASIPVSEKLNLKSVANFSTTDNGESAIPSGTEAAVDSSSDVSSGAEEPGKSSPNFNRASEWENFNNSMPRLGFPVPPMPMSFSQNDGAIDFRRGEFPALLMSWYMAGYQSGFFDAKHEESTSRSDGLKKKPTDRHSSDITRKTKV